MKINEELSTGWLSPDGSFFKCNTYDHVCSAISLVDKFGYSIDLSHADDILLNHGWVYVGISSFFCHEWRVEWEKFLTVSQKQFLKPYFEGSDLPVNDFSVLRWTQEGGFYRNLDFESEDSKK